MKKKVVQNLRQEVKVKADIVTSDDIKIYYTGKFQEFTARYIHVIKFFTKQQLFDQPLTKALAQGKLKTFHPFPKMFYQNQEVYLCYGLV